MNLNFSNCLCQNPKYVSWITLFFTALTVVLIGGKRGAFGVYIAELHKEFNNVSLMELNWIGDSYSALGYMMSSVCTIVIVYFNKPYGLFHFFGAFFIFASCITSSMVPHPHWLFLTHTLLHGIGSSMILSNIALVVNEHFDNTHPYHILATSILSGGSLPAIVFVPLFAYLIQQYTWRTSLVLLGSIYFIVLCIAAFFLKRKSDTKVIIDKKTIVDFFKKISKKQIPLLMLWFLERVLVSVVAFGLVLNLTDYVYRMHSHILGSTILTTLFTIGEGTSYLIGTTITAITKNFLKNKFKYILLMSSITLFIFLILLEFTNDFYILKRLLCFLTGLALGPSMGFTFPAGEELTMLPGNIAYPFSLGGIGVGILISPLMTAKIAELFSYKWFFFAQGCFIFGKVICLIISIILLKFYESNSVEKKDLLLHSLSNEDVRIEDETYAEDQYLIPKK